MITPDVRGRSARFHRASFAHLCGLLLARFLLRRGEALEIAHLHDDAGVLGERWLMLHQEVPIERGERTGARARPPHSLTPLPVLTVHGAAGAKANSQQQYGTGTDPRLKGMSQVVLDVETVSSQRYLRLAVPKNAVATDVTYEVQATGDLSDANSWSSSGLVIEANSTSSLRVRDNVPMGLGGRRFMRVRISQP